MKNNKNIPGIICILICEILFGFSYLFTKNITNTVPPINLLSWRFIVAFIVTNICTLTGLLKVNFKGKPLLKPVIMSVFHPLLYFIGETYGIAMTTASESGTIIASLPLVTMLLSALIIKKLPAKIQFLGVGSTFAGIIIITLSKGFEAMFNIYGYLMLFLGIIAYSLYAVIAETSGEFTDAEKTYVMIFLGFLAFTSIAVIYNARVGKLDEFLLLPFTNSSFLSAILYLGAGCSVIAFLTNNIAISCIGTNRCASFVGVSTIVSIIAGVIILGEKFSALQGIGSLLVLSGVYIANITNIKKT